MLGLFIIFRPLPTPAIEHGLLPTPCSHVTGRLHLPFLLLLIYCFLMNIIVQKIKMKFQYSPNPITLLIVFRCKKTKKFPSKYLPFTCPSRNKYYVQYKRVVTAYLQDQMPISLKRGILQTL